MTISKKTSAAPYQNSRSLSYTRHSVGDNYLASIRMADCVCHLSDPVRRVSSNKSLAFWTPCRKKDAFLSVVRSLPIFTGQELGPRGVVDTTTYQNSRCVWRLVA